MIGSFLSGRLAAVAAFVFAAGAKLKRNVFWGLISSGHVCTIGFLLDILYRYMVNAPKDSDETNSSPALTGALLTLTFLDTTWRLAVPSVGLTILGLYLDGKFGTTPWLMFVGIAIGSALAVYLVYLQLKRVNGSKKK